MNVRPSRTFGLLLAFALVLLPHSPTTASAPIPGPAPANSVEPIRAPITSGGLLFVENAGQWPAGAQFQVRGEDHTLWLAEDALWVTVVERQDGDAQSPLAQMECFALERPGLERADAPRKGANVRLSFPGANPHPRLEPFNRLDTVVSYFIGSDSARWRPDVPVWGGVRYVDLYPGVDLELSGADGRIAERLVARPGADLPLAAPADVVAAVKLRVEGAESVTVDGDVLRLNTAAGQFALPLFEADELPAAALQALRAPGGGQAFDVAAPFVRAGSGRRVQVGAGASPSDNPADLLYGTFLGGSDSDYGYGIAVDGAGSAYVMGETDSADFPTTPGAFDRSYNGSYTDAFVVKLNQTGSGLVYGTFLGGSDYDYGYGIAVDGAGSAYVTGETDSADFPTTPGAFDRSYNGGTCGTSPYTYPCHDAFVVKLNPAGSGLMYATYLGGSGDDWGSTIAVDAPGSAYVTGNTGSTGFPSTPGAFDTSFNGGNRDAFVVKLNPAGSGLAYATYLGGGGDDWGLGIAVDGAGSTYVTGYAGSSEFPTTPEAFDTGFNGGNQDAFVVKLNPAGSGLVYATYLGGGGDDSGYGIAVDGTGSAYVTGGTVSGDFPTTPGAFDTGLNGGDRDAFVVKLNPAGSGLDYATYLGGGGDDWGHGIAVDGMGSAYVAGSTRSSDFPVTPEAFDTSYSGGTCGTPPYTDPCYDAFVAKLNPAGSGLAYATYLGGAGHDWGWDIAKDAAGSAYVTGHTGSTGFPSTPGAFDTTHNGGSTDAFVVKLGMGAVAPTFFSFLPLILAGPAP